MIGRDRGTFGEDSKTCSIFLEGASLHIGPFYIETLSPLKTRMILHPNYIVLFFQPRKLNLYGPAIMVICRLKKAMKGHRQLESCSLKDSTSNLNYY